MSRSVSTRRPVTGWLLVSLISFSAGCSDSTAPGDHRHVAFEPAASVRWNALARDLVIKYKTDPPMASRTYALLSVAQDRAVTAAAAPASASPKPLDHAAVVSASAAILTAAYPQEAALIDSIARGDLADPLWSGDPALSVSESEAVGRAAAQQLLDERSRDGAFATWTGSVPTGAGMWYSTMSPPAPPLRPLWGSVVPCS